MQDDDEAGIRLGQIVVNPKASDWGPGKVLSRDGRIVEVRFEGLPESSQVRRLNLDCVGLEIVQTPATRPGAFPRQATKRGARNTTRGTIEESLQLFLSTFPGGFSDENYAKRERAWKWKAHQIYTSDLGGDRLHNLLRDGAFEEARRRILEVMGKSGNLLHPIEKSAFRTATEDPERGLIFFNALSALIDAPQPSEQTFTELARSLSGLSSPRKVQPEKWTVLTLFPFLARPDAFAFLKPSRTDGCAAYWGMELYRSAKPDWAVYDRFLKLSGELLGRLMPHGARDLIDVQSFIWVVGGRLVGDEYSSES